MARIYGWGRNFNGQLCLGTKNPKELSPVAGLLDKIIKIVSRAEGGLALLESGKVMSWGGNGESGAVGNGTLGEPVLTPVDIGLKNIVDIAAYGNHCLACDSEGHVFGWGQNWYGEVGDGTTRGGGTSSKGRTVAELEAAEVLSRKTSPVNIGNLAAVKVFAGPECSGCIRADKRILMWGGNTGGQLANGEKGKEKEVITPTLVEGVTEVEKVVMGGAPDEGKVHALALLTGGRIIGWGNGGHGELLPSKPTFLEPTEIPGLPEVVAIGAGLMTSYAVKSNGDLLAWGNNIHGQLGTGTEEILVLTPKVILKEATAVAAYGTSKPKGFGDEVSGVVGFGVAIKNDKLYCWGLNAQGEVGDGTTTYRYSPVPANLTLTGTDKVVRVTAGEWNGTALVSPGPLVEEITEGEPEPEDTTSILGSAILGYAVLSGPVTEGTHIEGAFKPVKPGVTLTLTAVHDGGTGTLMKATMSAITPYTPVNEIEKVLLENYFGGLVEPS